MEIDNKCPHCVLIPLELKGIDPRTGKRFTKIDNQGPVKCDLVSENVLIPKEHFTRYCFNDYQKCIGQQKYEEWMDWIEKEQND